MMSTACISFESGFKTIVQTGMQHAAAKISRPWNSWGKKKVVINDVMFLRSKKIFSCLKYTYKTKSARQPTNHHEEQQSTTPREVYWYHGVPDQRRNPEHVRFVSEFRSMELWRASRCMRMVYGSRAMSTIRPSMGIVWGLSTRERFGAAWGLATRRVRFGKRVAVFNFLQLASNWGHKTAIAKGKIYCLRKSQEDLWWRNSNQCLSSLRKFWYSKKFNS